MAEIHISNEKLRAEMEPFKQWSGPKIAKVFGKTNIPDFEYNPIGSGGFIFYRNRYFFVTNHHVVESIEGDVLENTVVTFLDEGIEIAKFVGVESDKEIDICVLEIDHEFAQKHSYRQFLSSDCFENTEEYLGRCNFVFIHGFPYANTEIDFNARVIETTSLPYMTFIEGYNEDLELIRLSCNKEENVDEFGQAIQLPEFFGMSGSFVFSYRLRDIANPYGLLGVITMGTLESGTIWIVPAEKIISFIDNKFFE